MYPIRYCTFFDELMDNEGWISDDSEFDSGGHTICGLSKNNFPKEHAILWRMIESGEPRKAIIAFLRKFYYFEFYNTKYESINDSSLAFRIFDFGVNAGVVTSVRILQKSINKSLMFYPHINIIVDGVFGSNTLKAVNLVSNPISELVETDFYHAYVENIEKHYRSLWNFFRFGKGWLKRVKAIFNKASNLNTKSS